MREIEKVSERQRERTRREKDYAESVPNQLFCLLHSCPEIPMMSVELTKDSFEITSNVSITSQYIRK